MTARTADWRIVLWVVIAIATLGFLYMVRGILLPFIIAILISALLHPIYRMLRKNGWGNGMAAFVPMLVFFGTLLVGLIALMPIITNQVGGLRDRGEQIVSSLAKPNPLDNFFMRGNPENRLKMASNKDPVDQFLGNYSDLLSRFNLPSTKRELIAQYIEPQRDHIKDMIQNLIKGSFSAATGFLSQGFTLIFVPLLVWFILPNTQKFKKKFLNLIPPQLRESSIDLADDIGDVFSNYLRGVAIAVFGYMAFMAILLSILGAPYGLLLGCLFGAIYLIPYLNVLISGTTLFLVTGLSGKVQWFGVHFSSSWAYAGVLVATYVICHFIFDSMVYPRYVGNAVGLDPIVSMFVIFCGGALFGLPGMILAFPIAGSVKVLLDRLIKVTNKVDVELVLPEIPLRHRKEAL
ncbi:MAG: AI-2E family transporter [Armatimonadetes bacterium]|nr:AI-2E family transporter [Armatimonadota bacterium]